MRNRFRRVSPAQFAERVGIPLGWIVVSWHCMPDKSERRQSHGKWFRLKGPNGTVFRVLRFSGNLEGSESKGEADLVIDWPAWLELNGYAEDLPERIDVEIEKARFWHVPWLAASHPDPAFRLASILGMISVVLGLFSLVLVCVI